MSEAYRATDTPVSHTTVSSSKLRWILKSINDSPIMAALLACGAFFFGFGVLLNLAMVQPPDEQQKVWFLDLAGEGWALIFAGALGWASAIAAYHAWNHRYLFAALCLAGQGYLLQDVALGRLWAVAVIVSIFAVGIDYVQSD